VNFVTRGQVASILQVRASPRREWLEDSVGAENHTRAFGNFAQFIHEDSASLPEFIHNVAVVHTPCARKPAHHRDLGQS
jgi:hypothetical protein